MMKAALFTALFAVTAAHAHLVDTDLHFGQHAPEVELLSEPEANATTYTPVVFLHGMGDAGSNPGMQSLCKTASTKYPGMYSVCSNVANGLSSIMTVLDKQLDEFTQSIRADPKLANGFNAVGLSQGNLVIRAYIERVNNPPVKKYVSICGPHSGVGTCPDNLLFRLVCPIWKLGPYSAQLAFADYWRGEDQAEFLQKSRFLADLNNEREQKNETYKQNIIGLEKYVMVEALNDTMVIPHKSEQHGTWPYNEKDATPNEGIGLRDTDGYKGDWLGLQTLDKAGKIDIYTYVGEHLRFSNEFWNDKILPVLGNN
jgi:palmitoyl-protein thioesterase